MCHLQVLFMDMDIPVLKQLGFIWHNYTVTLAIISFLTSMLFEGGSNVFRSQRRLLDLRLKCSGTNLRRLVVKRRYCGERAFILILREILRTASHLELDARD